jgi:hypothetical protein
MGKFIIHNRTNLSDLEALSLVRRVVELGRLSNEGRQYAFHVELSESDARYSITTRLNPKSDVFIIENVTP